MTRLFHVSDVHFGAEDPAAIAWFNALVKAERPDAVVMTGDLTMRARSKQFSAAAAWLQGLGVPVTVEVGNHDLPYFNPWKRFVTPYHRYEVVERLTERPLKLDGIAIVPLKTTARVHWRLDWTKGHTDPEKDPSVLGEAMRLAENAEVCLVIGTSALVHPAAGLADLTRRHGGSVIEINVADTPLTPTATVSLRGPAAAIVPDLLAS